MKPRCFRVPFLFGLLPTLAILLLAPAMAGPLDWHFEFADGVPVKFVWQADTGYTYDLYFTEDLAVSFSHVAGFPKDGTGGVLSSAIVGTGEAKVAEQIALMVHRGYAGWINLENYYSTGPLAHRHPEPFDTMKEDVAALCALVETAPAGGDA